MKKILKGILPIYVVVDGALWVLKKLIPGFINLPRKTQRFLAILLIFTTLITSGGLIYLFNPLGTNNAQAAWFDDNWAYREPITITNGTTADISDYQKLLTLDTSTLVTAGKLQSACQDLRFTNQSGKVLPFFIDSGCNTTTTKVWVLIDTIYASTKGTTTVYMYYGNAIATAGSNAAQFGNVQGLVGYWPLNDGSSTTSTDYGPLADNHTVTGYIGFASAATNTTVSDATKNWSTNLFAALTITITSGTGVGQTRTISSNTTTQITVSSAWTTNPDTTSVFTIGAGPTWSSGGSCKFGNCLSFNAKSDITYQKVYATSQSVTIVTTGGSSTANFTGLSTYATTAQPYLYTIASVNCTTPGFGYLGAVVSGDTVKIISTRTGATQSWAVNPTGGTCNKYEIRRSDFQLVGNFTLSAWINKTTDSAIITKFTSPTRQFRISFSNSKFRCDAAGSQKSTIANVSNSVWHHVACVYTTTPKTIDLYVDGVLDTGASGSGPSSLTDTPHAVMLGGEGQNSAPDMAGFIDDAKIFNVAKTPDQILKEFNTTYSLATVNTPPTTSLGSEENAPSSTAYWKFDDATGTSAKDSSSNANTGTLGGVTIPTWQAENQCISGKCLFFDGTSSKVTGSKAALSVKSVSFWVYPNTIASQGIINLNDGSSRKINTDGSGVISGSGFTSPSYYINGQATTTPTLVQNRWNFVTITTATGVNSGTALTIGTDGTNFIKGFIDEVKLYGYTRSASQVLTDYNSTGTVKGASTTISASINQPAALSNGLVGYYKMDEASWTNDCSTSTVTDSSGNSNTGKSCPNSTGPTGGSVTAKFGNAGSFDGTNDYLEVVDANSLDVTQTTISAWLNPTATSGTILQKSTLAGTDGYSVDFSSNKIRFCAAGGCASSTTSLSTSSWQHIIVTFDGSTTRFYLNGVSDGTSTTITSIPTNAFVLRMAGDSSAGTLYSGKMDEVRVFNRALSTNDIPTLYNFAPGPGGYWKLDENTGTSAFDSSGIGNTGTLTNLAAPATATSGWAPKGKYGSAINFDGTNDMVSITDPTDGSLDMGNNNFTLMAWVKLSASNIVANPSIIEKGGTSLAVIGYWLEYEDSGNRLEFKMTDGSTRVTVNGTKNLKDGIWHHVALTIDRAGSAQFYVDGAKDTTTGTISTINGNTISGTNNFRISTTASGSTWTGGLDEVKVYKYIRTQAQIIEDMNAFHPAPGSPVGTPTGYWKFNEGADNTCSGGTNDACNSGSGGNALDGAATNMASPATAVSGWTQSGKFGNALLFDPTTSPDYIAMPSDAAALKITGTLSLSAWINMTSTSAQNDIICKWTNTAASSSYCLAVNTSGKLIFKYSSGAPAITTVTGTQTLSTGTWYHVVAIFEPNNQIVMYINGVQDKQATTTATSLTNSTTILDIGAENAGTNSFNGAIDEAKVFSGALSAFQVLVDMNQGQSQVLGAISDKSTYQKQAANQEYCVPGDSATCTAPVGRWEFEEGTGSSANDSSGGNSTGTITGATFAPGKVGKALNFNGGTDTVSVSNSLSTKTVEFWVYPTTTTQNLIDLRTAATAVNISVSSGTILATGFSSPTIYVNGKVSSTLVANNWQYVAITTASTITANAIVFGSISSISLTGKLDAIRVYDYPRSDLQIAWDYNRGGPIGWWKFDECQGGVANDSSGNANPGTITIGGSGTQATPGTCSTSSTAWGNGATGKRNYSLNFDGTDDYIDFGNPSLFQLTSAITVAGWANISDLDNYRPILSKGATGNVTKRGAWILYGNISNLAKPSFTIYTSTETVLNAGSPITAGWHHVVGTYDGTTLKLYVDGILSNSTPLSGSISNPNYNVLAGAIDSNGSIGTWQNNQLDDLRIYNYALTATQIKTLYTNNSVNFAPSTGAP